MPNIKISGLDKSRVQQLSADITASLAEVIGCPMDWLTFSMNGSGTGDIFCCGSEAYDTVFVYVEWFDRGDTAKTAVAKIITDAISVVDKIETVDIIFVDIAKTDYYENGEHF